MCAAATTSAIRPSVGDWLTSGATAVATRREGGSSEGDGYPLSDLTVHTHRQHGCVRRRRCNRRSGRRGIYDGSAAKSAQVTERDTQSRIQHRHKHAREGEGPERTHILTTSPFWMKNDPSSNGAKFEAQLLVDMQVGNAGPFSTWPWVNTPESWEQGRGCGCTDGRWG